MLAASRSRYGNRSPPRLQKEHGFADLLIFASQIHFGLAVSAALRYEICVVSSHYGLGRSVRAAEC